MSPEARRTAGANGVAPPRTSSSAQRPTSAGEAAIRWMLLHSLPSCAAHLQPLSRALRAHSPMSLGICMLQAWRHQAPAR